MAKIIMNRVVYSTELGRLCPECQKPKQHCACQQLKKTTAASKTTDGIVRIQRQTKGRNGKPVCVISGLPLNAEALNTLAKALKQNCGSGGAVKDGCIEIQGDKREQLKQLLEAMGFVVKLSGG